MRYIFILRYLFILSVILCTSCGTALPTVKPYKLDVQQGNVVTSKMLLQLRPGMTKSQVRFIMGTPLIQDSFHGNRWDYVYQLRIGGKITEQRRVILDFENELLRTVRGDVIPAGSDQATEEPTNAGTRVIQPNTKPQDKSVLDKLKFWKKDEAPADAKKETGKASPETVIPVKEEATPPAEQVAPAEEPKSLLVVPVEQMAAPETPVINTPPAEPEVAAPAPVVEPPKAESVPVESAPAEQAKVEKAPVSESVSESLLQPVQPENAPPYDSSSGMQFDKNLKSAPEEVVSEPVVTAPRAGNKTPPKPKDLPAEGEPGFFDRMLEKIGF